MGDGRWRMHHRRRRVGHGRGRMHRRWRDGTRRWCNRRVGRRRSPERAFHRTPPAQIRTCGFPAPGSCRRSGVIGRARRLLRSADPQAGDGYRMPSPASAPGASPCRLPSLRPSPLPSTPPPPASSGFVRALHRYYERRPTPRVCSIGGFGSSPSRRGPGSPRATAGQTRSPRFRRDPFVRDVASDPGRATAPRITAPHMLPSAQ